MNLVKSIVDAVTLLGVDGVDLAQRDGCGKYNMRCEDQSSTHLAVLQKLRQAMPNKVGLIVPVVKISNNVSALFNIFVFSR